MFPAFAQTESSVAYGKRKPLVVLRTQKSRTAVQLALTFASRLRSAAIMVWSHNVCPRCESRTRIMCEIEQKDGNCRLVCLASSSMHEASES